MQQSQIGYLINHYKYTIGIIAKLLAISCFCLLSITFERLSIAGNLNSTAQFGIVCLIGSVLLLPIIAFFYINELKGAQLKFYPLRALISIFAMVSWIEAVKHFGSAQSILVNYLAPIITILIASVTKDEKLKWVCICSGIICYIIIFFALRTEISLANYGFSMAIISALCYALYEVICKKQSVQEHFVVQAFYTFLFAAILLLPFYIKSLPTIAIADVISLSFIAVLRIAIVIFLFIAIKFATLNYLTPVSYMKFPLMAILGYVFMNKSLAADYWAAAAALIVVNILMIYFKRYIDAEND